MDNEGGFDPRMDDEFQQFLAQKRAAMPQAKPAQPQHYTPEPYRVHRAEPQTTDRNGVGRVDRSVQEGEVLAVIQKHYTDKKRGEERYNGQTRIVLKEFKGNQYVSIENWKVHEDDVMKQLHAQKHIWAGAANVSIANLRELGDKISELAKRLDGGVVR